MLWGAGDTPSLLLHDPGQAPNSNPPISGLWLPDGLGKDLKKPTQAQSGGPGWGGGCFAMEAILRGNLVTNKLPPTTSCNHLPVGAPDRHGPHMPAFPTCPCPLSHGAHRWGADETGQFYLDFQLVQSAQGASPLVASPVPGPVSPGWVPDPVSPSCLTPTSRCCPGSGEGPGSGPEVFDLNGTCAGPAWGEAPREDRRGGGGFIVGWQTHAVGNSPPQPWGPPASCLPVLLRVQL